MKAILVPAALNMDLQLFLGRIKRYMEKNPQVEVVFLNIFGDMEFPSMIYRLEMKATILINLFLVTNEKRFSEIMIGNAQFTDHSFSWLISNRTLTETILDNLCESMKIEKAMKG